MFSVLVQFERVTQQHKGSGSTGNRVSVAWMDANYIDLCAVALAPSSTTGRFFLSLQIAIYGSVWVALGGGCCLSITCLLACFCIFRGRSTLEAENLTPRCDFLFQDLKALDVGKKGTGYTKTHDLGVFVYPAGSGEL